MIEVATKRGYVEINFLDVRLDGIILIIILLVDILISKFLQCTSAFCLF